MLVYYYITLYFFILYLMLYFLLYDYIIVTFYYIVVLESGDVVIMGPGCQEHYRHGVRQKLRPEHDNDFRINITFRQQHAPLADRHGLGDVDPGWSEMVESNEAVFFSTKIFAS